MGLGIKTKTNYVVFWWRKARPRIENNSFKSSECLPVTITSDHDMSQ